MISSFQKTARRTPHEVFFRFVEKDGAVTAVTYDQARLRATALLRYLRSVFSLEPGSLVACDLENCPAFIYLLLACQYGGLNLVALNHRLTAAEKAERAQSVGGDDGVRPCPILDEADLSAALAVQLGQDSEEVLRHAADGLEGVAGRLDPAVVMFTSGTTGKAKAARLDVARLCGSAAAFNRAFACDAGVIWQVSLPLYHVGGLQMVVRSILNGTPFLLYRSFNAQRILADAADFRATHISVVDKTLRELVEAGTASQSVPASAVEADGEGEPEQPEQPERPEQPADQGEYPEQPAPTPAPEAPQDTAFAALRAYRCILLGGAAPNPATLAAARNAQAHVFSSYGMTETCSLVAACPIVQDDGAALRPLPGYEACIVSPDAAGRGQLGVRGPGIFAGYLHARTSFTADGFFLTGDTASMVDGCIFVAERTQDMFVSGGENVYPEEIRKRLLGIPGVTDAYVFGAKDPLWGRRPVAFVEMANAQVLPQNSVQLAEQVRLSLKARLAKIYQPDRLYAINSFPRTGIGKVDRRNLEARDEQALDIREVRVHRVRQPFVKPVKTAKETLRARESLLVEVVDHQGRVGTGEDASFATDWYLPETIAMDRVFLEEQAIPLVLEQAYLQPDAVYGALMRLPGARDHLMAVAALETALWDLYGKIVQRSISQLISARTVWDVRGKGFTLSPGFAPGGAVIGLGSVASTVAAAKEAVDAGYLRVKLKIRPADALQRVAAVREALPDAIIMLDANQSFTDDQLPLLRQLDQYRCAGIEEPLDPQYVPAQGPRDLFSRLANLQQCLSTPIFLDESIVTPEDAERALEFIDLRGFVLKIGKWGGIMPANDFYWKAREHGATVWMGGMFDTGVSKRLHAAFSLLPGITIPGDINDTARYFRCDVTEPPLELEEGCLQVNPPQAPYGVGCSLDAASVAQVRVETRTYRRGCLPAVVTGSA